MPLLDHFHPPLHPTRHWESFHSRWATAIADALDRTLPPRYFAEVQIHLGSRIEADVAEFESASLAVAANGSAGGVGVQTWAPPAPPLVMPAVFPDDFEIQLRDNEDDARLVAVIELISPGNKDRSETRRAFAAKCAAYLQRGIGLIIVDIVTSRAGNLHNDLIQTLGQDSAFLLAAAPALYAVAYHPTRRNEVNLIEMWPSDLGVGANLPLLPLSLRGSGFIPLDLEATYTDARQRSRL
jgi:Protein of unknown function (DUF4058)